MARLRTAIMDNDAPRVLGRKTLANMINEINGSEVPQNKLTRIIHFCTEVGLINKIQRDVYTNAMALPVPVIDEVAEVVSPGCRISLQRALGAYGIANNPSNIITVVVPFKPGETPKLGSIIVGDRQFRLHGMPQAVFDSGEPEDVEARWNRPIPGTVRLATPEKALLDWIYLGTSRQSNMTLPPYGDIHLEDIDVNRLNRLAKAANLEGPADRWLQHAQHVQGVDWEDHAREIGLKF